MISRKNIEWLISGGLAFGAVSVVALTAEVLLEEKDQLSRQVEALGIDNFGLQNRNAQLEKENGKLSGEIADIQTMFVMVGNIVRGKIICRNENGKDEFTFENLPFAPSVREKLRQYDAAECNIKLDLR